MSRAKKKLLFIANPISGARGKVPLEELLPRHLDSKQFEWDIYYTQAKGDATRKAMEVLNNVDAFVAVGGDGTINEVAQGLVYTDTPMGIIPNGSGNGFANYFNISLKPEEAIERINTYQIRSIDTGLFNDQLFLCVAGLGFDADVAHAFDQSPTRGFYTYAMITLKLFLRYQPHNYQIEVDDKELARSAFLITAANATQFGNNAFIAPKARIDDGLLDLVVLKPFNLWNAIKVTRQLFQKRLNHSPFYQCIRTREITIKSTNPTAQIDGEPIRSEGVNIIRVQPLSLKMIV